MLCVVTVVDDNVINYPTETREALKSFIHASIIMFIYRGDSIWCTHVFKSTKWHNKGGEKLTFLIERALMVALHGI